MTLQQTLQAARKRLRDNRQRFDVPRPQSLSANPLLCASCLRWAVLHNAPELALAAASTLQLFDPERLRKSLLLCAVEVCGIANLSLLEGVAATDADLTKRRCTEDRWLLASAIIIELCKAPKSTWGRDFARLSYHFRHWWNDGIELGALEGEYGARSMRLLQQLSSNLSSSDTAHRDCEKRPSISVYLDRAANAGVPWPQLDLAEFLWRKTSRREALVLPIEWVQYRQGGGCISASAADRVEGRAIPVQAATHETPQGFRALRAWLSSRPEVSKMLNEFGVPMNGAVEVIGQCLGRIEERGGTDRLAQSVKWLGVTWLKPCQGKELGEVIAAHTAAIDALRLEHLSPPAQLQACPTAAQGSLVAVLEQTSRLPSAPPKLIIE